MRSSMLLAFSSPSASLNTLRTYSSLPMPSEVWRCMPVRKSSTEVRTMSRDTFCRAAMAVPIFCTSRGPSSLMTSAAADSPRVIRKMAALSTPFSSTFSSAMA